MDINQLDNYGEYIVDPNATDKVQEEQKQGEEYNNYYNYDNNG